jgi:hypothetical protein
MSGKIDTGAGFLRVLRFPLPILIPLHTPFGGTLIPPAALWPWSLFSQQKWVPGIFLGVNGGRHVKASTSQNRMGLRGLLQGYSFTLFTYFVSLIAGTVDHLQPKYQGLSLTPLSE